MTDATTTAPPARDIPEGASWGQVLRPYARPDVPRALLDVATSVVPYVALWAAMVAALDVSYLLVLALAVPASGFLLRTYIVFHDCAHGSFLPSRRTNAWLGRLCGLLVVTPFEAWRHNHAVHHATAGDLDRRGVGDVPTHTVAEFHAMSPLGRLGYRLFRNPLVMFGLGPIFAMVIGPRLVPKGARPRIRNSILLCDLALAVVVGALVWLLGWQTVLLVQLPCVLLAGATGIWLFYVQHQFEDTYWERGGDWSYADAALRGSSHLRLPKVLQFFTGNIGLHHVHHLSARIPNYHLQRAHDDHPVFRSVPTLTMADGLRATRLKLWDEDLGRLVTFPEARRARSSRSGAQHC